MDRDRTRTLVIADDPLVRSGLSALLAGLPEVVVSGQAASAELAAALQVRGHDVLAWTPGPARDGTSDPLRAAAAAGVPVVAIVSGSEEAAAALRAGARGLVHRSADAALLGAALAAAAAGLVVLEPSLADEWVRQPVAAGGEPLTPREREVLGLLAEGLGNKAIASRLGISEHTAKFHVNAILAKLGAGSRSEAIVLAARQGLVVL